MTTRRSNRLAAKHGETQDELARIGEKDDRAEGRRASVGGALGLTPARPKGRNLAVAKAAGAAEAAAARLDELNAGDQRGNQKRAKRKSSKARKRSRRRKEGNAEQDPSEASGYAAKSRESLALFENTRQMFDVDEQEEEESEGQASMPDLQSESDGKVSDSEEEAKADDEEVGESSVICTPGPQPQPTQP